MNFPISLNTENQRFGRYAQFLGLAGAISMTRVSPFIQLIFLGLAIAGYMIAKSSEIEESIKEEQFGQSRDDRDYNKKMIARALKKKPSFFRFLHKRYKKDFSNPKLKRITRMAIEKYGQSSWML